MNKITVIYNDFGSNIKSYITYGDHDIEAALLSWDKTDARLTKLNELAPFKGYSRWDELTVQHYRFLISQCLNTLSSLSPDERTNTGIDAVSTTNHVILCFMIHLEKLTSSGIEHFRINRFDNLHLTFDYSASYEMQYDKPRAKSNNEPLFNIIVNNSDDIC